MAKRARDVRTLLTPADTGLVVSLANPAGGLPLLRKRILPEKQITYQGQPVKFDRAYHQSLIDAFKAGAMDQVPLQFAGRDNSHTMDVERTRGEIVGLSLAQPGDVDGPGLYATIKPHSRKAVKVIKHNPMLGVSCQIREGVERVDGAKFPRVLRHVLATLDPRVVQLGQWRHVSLSGTDDGRVLNLTAADFEEIPVAKGASRRAQDDLNLSEDEAEQAVADALAELEEDEIAGEPTDDDSKAKKPKGAAVSDKSGKGGKSKDKGVKLSNRGSGRDLELAVTLDEQATELRAVQGQLALSRWQTERAALSLAGVPKPFLDLAEPLLSSADSAVLSLSNEDGEDGLVDAAKIVRDILDVSKGLMSFANPGGVTQDPADAANQEDAQVAAQLKQWKDQYGD